MFFLGKVGSVMVVASDLTSRYLKELDRLEEEVLDLSEYTALDICRELELTAYCLDDLTDLIANAVTSHQQFVFEEVLKWLQKELKHESLVVLQTDEK